MELDWVNIEQGKVLSKSIAKIEKECKLLYEAGFDVSLTIQPKTNKIDIPEMHYTAVPHQIK